MEVKVDGGRKKVSFIRERRGSEAVKKSSFHLHKVRQEFHWCFSRDKEQTVERETCLCLSTYGECVYIFSCFNDDRCQLDDQ